MNTGHNAALGAPAARKRLRQFADRERAVFVAGYFKTGPGQYGHGDRFLGTRVPDIRRVAREFRDLDQPAIRELLASPWHEDRLLALVILVDQYTRGDARAREAVYRLYLANTRHINNWDLVDVSAPKIVGAHLAKRSRTPLYVLARSRNLWERRIAILATAWFIRDGEIGPTLRIATMLLDDAHDLLHKATGWMLREAAKQDRATTERFLRRHQRRMPRT
ncbi:MAG: DNA alkylation repair protein, partial [Gemmatimonadales bacterium]